MAASFLPYCAHCDKQIVIPNSNILYCSESCRRKDQKQQPIPISGSGSQSSSYTPSNGWSTPPFSSYQSFADLPPPPNFIAPSSPTSTRSIPFAHTQNSEPIAIARSHNDNRQDNLLSSAPSSPSNSHNLYQPPRRPAHLYRNSTTGSFISAMSTSNSISSSASAAYYPTQGQYHNHNRSVSYYSSSPRSLDLVTPLSSVSSQQTAPQATNEATSERLAGEEKGLYEKKWALPMASTSQTGSLKKLFNFDGMRANASPARSRAGSRATSPVRQSGSSSPVPAEKSRTSLTLKSDWSDIY